MTDDDNDATLSFVRSHRAPRTMPKINLIAVLVLLGAALLVTTGVMINADLGIL